MSAPSSDVPRLLECGTATTLAECSHLAMRVYLHLFWGEGSERPGFGRCRPGELADVLQSSRRAVVAALNELQDRALIVWSESEALAYRPGFANRFNPRDWRNHANWFNAAARLRDGFIASQVREDIGPRRQATSQATSDAASEATWQDLSVSSVSSVSSLSSHIHEKPVSVADAPAKAMDSLSIPYAKPIEPKPSKAKRQGFTIPTEAETRDIFTELGCPQHRLVEVADATHSYWQSVGWKRKSGPIKDWKATCRTRWIELCQRDPSLLPASRKPHYSPDWLQDDMPPEFFVMLNPDGTRGKQ